jgi:hypothetical protein
MPVSTADIVSIHRSAAMLNLGQPYPIEREVLMSLCDELLEVRSLLERMGTDLRAIAAKAPKGEMTRRETGGRAPTM